MQWSPDPYALDLAEQTGFVITDVIRDLPEEPQKKSKHRLLAQKLYLLELLRDFCFGPGSPNFWPEVHISCYATVQGLDLFRNVIVSGYDTFYQIIEFFVNIQVFLYR